VGEEATPAVPAPAGLRPFLQFAKLPPPALKAARRALDHDDEFRARVAEVLSEDDVGRAGWLYLARPAGWEEELAGRAAEATLAGETAADRRAENDARRRLAGAEAATRRAEESAAAAQAEASRAAGALAEERRARRAATEEAALMAGQLQQLRAERDRLAVERDRAREVAGQAEAAAAALRREGDGLRTSLAELERRAARPQPEAPLPAPAVAAVSGEQVVEAGRALAEASSAAARMAEALQAVAWALGGSPAPPPRGGAQAPPASTPAPAALPTRPVTRPRRSSRRTPVPLPPAVLDDSPEAAEHLVRVPNVLLLVDGYNVSQTGWPDLPIAEQRRRLVDALAELAARTTADVHVVFDGSDPPWPPTVPATLQPVRVSFSPPDVEADDVVLARVADVDPGRPVVVASSDRRVRDGAADQGANVLTSAQLLAALRR
jgi:predicted RNA-binding protein with PIN domain